MRGSTAERTNTTMTAAATATETVAAVAIRNGKSACHQGSRSTIAAPVHEKATYQEVVVDLFAAVGKRYDVSADMPPGVQVSVYGVSSK